MTSLFLSCSCQTFGKLLTLGSEKLLSATATSGRREKRERKRSIYEMLIDRRGLFSGCRVYSALTVAEPLKRARGREGGCFSRTRRGLLWFVLACRFRLFQPPRTHQRPTGDFAMQVGVGTGNGDKRESIQKMVASIAITANKILRSQGVNVAYRGTNLFPAALKKEFKIIEFLRTFRTRTGKILR